MGKPVKTVMLVSACDVLFLNMQKDVTITMESFVKYAFGTKSDLRIINTSDESFGIQVGGVLNTENTLIKRGYAEKDTGPLPLMAKLRITNNGFKTVKNPSVTFNNIKQWRTLADIISAIMERYQPTSNKEKLLAVWRFFCDYLDDSRGGYITSSDPVITLNSCGFAGCFHLAMMMLAVFKQMGFKNCRFTEVGNTDHSLPEVYYDGKYHMVDACLYTFFLDEHNELAGIDDLQKNYSLTKNTIHHNGAAGFDDEPRIFANDYYRTHITTDTINIIPQPLQCAHTMDFELRPGESIERYWENRSGKYGLSAKTHQLAELTPKPASGNLVFSPSIPAIEMGTIFESVRNAFYDDQVKGIRPERAGSASELIIIIHCPYIITGGYIEIEYQNNDLENSISVDVLQQLAEWSHLVVHGWKQVGEIKKELGHGKQRFDLDDFIKSKDEQLVFEYRLRINTRAACDSIYLKNFKVWTDFQCSYFSGPIPKLGSNTVFYHDDSPEIYDRKIELEINWHEYTMPAPPVPPIALRPATASPLDRNNPIFYWNAQDQNIIDFHVQVSEYNDFRWPVSPNFERYISRTRYSGKQNWQPMDTRHLEAGKQYFWRIRSLSHEMVWSNWSEPLMFAMQ